MINALHSLLYSDDPPATRAFLRDVLGMPYLTHDESAPDWLIFKTGPSELGVHPNSWSYGGETTTVPVHHEISLMCDDIEQTITELGAKGAEFSGPPVDRGFGIGTLMRVPGVGEVLIYQPTYSPATDL